MTNDEMIANFLKSNTVTKCDDESRGLDGEVQSRKSRQFAASNMPSYRERLEKKYESNCEICNKVFAAYPQDKEKYGERGVVDNIYKADIWCRYCLSQVRKRGLNNVLKTHESYIANMEIESRYRKLDKIISSKDIVGAKEDDLITMIDDLEWLIEAGGKVEHEQMLRLAKRELLIIEDDKEFEGL